MRTLLLVLALVQAGARPAVPAAHQWQSGKWAAAPDVKTYRIENLTVRVHLEDLEPGERRAIDVVAGTAVRFAVEGDKVYVQDRAGAPEHTLKLLRRVSLVYEAVGGGHLIKSVGPGGATITLEDGSVWQVDPRNQYSTAGWQPLEGITVRPVTPENGYAYEIDNTDQDLGTPARYSPPE